MRNCLYRKGLVRVIVSLALLSVPFLHAKLLGMAENLPQSQAVIPQGVSDSAIRPSDALYRLGAGDIVTVEDANLGLLLENGRILDDGSLPLPLVGRVTVSGLTMAQARETLNVRYKTFYVTPALRVQLVSQRPLRVYVSGGVAHPGVYVSGKTLNPDGEAKTTLGDVDNDHWYSRLYLTDALMMAGGLSPTADARDVRIHRGHSDAETRHVNLLALFAEGNTLNDLPLQDQDRIEVLEVPENQQIHEPNWEALVYSNVTRQGFRVSVMGAVQTPGAFRMNGKSTVLDAVAKAGGFSDVANKSRLYIIRTTPYGQVVKREVNLTDRKLMARQPLASWAALRPNDVVFVDESALKQTGKYTAGLLDRASPAAILPIFNRLFNGRNF